jgi:hypothetical protein
MSKPILALIPSGYKDEVVYSILPNNGDGDFEFDRASKGTRVRKDGLLEEVGSASTDIPRLDWSDGNCPSLLLEPQRSNQVIKSETLTDTSNATTGWDSNTFGSGTISVDSGFISPAGELNAYKFTIGGVASGNNGCLHTHDDFNGTRFNDAGDYSISVWLRGEVGGEIVPIDFRSRTSTGLTGDEFTLTTEWKRYTVTVNKASASNTSGGFQFRFYNRSDIADQVFYAFGCQIEKASYVSSYIKSDDGSAIKTRVKDQCLNGGDSDLFDITEGTFFVDANNFGTPLNDYSMITISDGTVNNYIRYIYESSRIRVSVLGLGDYFITGVNDNERNKVVTTFKENEMKVFFNGSLVHTDTLGVLPTNMDRLNFASQSGTSRHFEGKVYDTRVYDRVLTEAEAIELTTL